MVIKRVCVRHKNGHMYQRTDRPRKKVNREYGQLIFKNCTMSIHSGENIFSEVVSGHLHGCMQKDGVVTGLTA